MTKFAILLPAAALAIAACAPEPPPPTPQPMVRVDTVVVTREVAPPLPEGRVATLCLAHGRNAEIRISSAGDTLVGPRRVRLTDLGTAIGFIGDYASDESWYINDDRITFEGRAYSKFGQPEVRDCDAMKIVGDHQGVNLFAETAASSPFPVLYVPVRAGVFQPYQSQVGRVRG